MILGMMIPFIVFGGPLLNSFYGNIDGLVALGLLLPPQWGLLVLMLKPQIGLPVAIFWMAEAMREGGVRRVLWTLSPLMVMTGMSVLIYGTWFLKTAEVTTAVWNSSPWPWGIPAGMALLGVALWKRRLGWALMAVPFLTPYLAIHSWAFLWAGLGMALNGKEGV